MMDGKVMIPGKEYAPASMKLGGDNGQTATNLWLFVAAEALVGQIRRTRRRVHREGQDRAQERKV